MDILATISDYFVIPVIVACLVIGYCIKHIKWLEAISNQYIPTILVVCGIIVACALNWGKVDVEIIISGAISGLASTGFHQAFKNAIENSSKEDV